MSDWRFDAACLEADPELFFPIGNTGPALLQIEEAKQVCRGCPVRETCLDWAVDTGQNEGVWGGLSEDERRSLKRKISRAARPEKPRVRNRQSPQKLEAPKLTSEERKIVPAEATLVVVQNFRKGPEPLSWRKIGLRLRTSDKTCRQVYRGEQTKVTAHVETNARKLLDA